MPHAYAARGSRQMAVFTAIVGFHCALFLVITMGLMPRGFEPVPEPIPVTPLPPESKPKPVLVNPGDRLEEWTVDVLVEQPDVRLPVFDEAAATPEEAPRDAGNSETTPPSGEYVAPRLRTRSGSLAALIDTCYPAASRRINEEGRVIAQVLIGAQGSALTWSIEQSSGFPRLDAAAACVLGKLEFIAARPKGQAVAAEARLPIVFHLD